MAGKSKSTCIVVGALGTIPKVKYNLAITGKKCPSYGQPMLTHSGFLNNSFINGFFFINKFPMATKGRNAGKYTENSKFKKMIKLHHYKMETTNLVQEGKDFFFRCLKDSWTVA